MKNVNKVGYDVLKYIYTNPNPNQRQISKDLSLSLGLVNKTLRMLVGEGFLNDRYELEAETLNLVEKPKSAIILAAGMGTRLTPITQSLPKALVKVYGKTLIENVIEKLHEVGVTKIYIVVGYKKEEFEYLMDLYDVKLISNNEYKEKNNVYSLYLARKFISSSYIIPCDLWLEENPFHSFEMNSWYLLSNEKKATRYHKNKDGLIQYKKNKEEDYIPLGITYIHSKDASVLKELLSTISSNEFYRMEYYWEDVALASIPLYYEIQKGKTVEINYFEDLRDLDEHSESFDTEILNIIQNSLHVSLYDIQDIQLSKKGMTNHSFLFTVKNQKYIMRIPGEGTDQLINREEEANVYKAIQPYHLSDELIYINPNNGYKMTKFIENSRVCDSENVDDLKLCMKFLKEFHDKEIQVEHTFDIVEKIHFYELLMGFKSLYKDYKQTKAKVMKLAKLVESFDKHMGLTHIDAVCDNFLIYDDNKVKLIDWEYASMQDTDVDLAMFSIYAMYDREQIDQLIDIYYDNQCEKERRIKIYCYVAMCGFLWSNWCEYKAQLGIEFGDYSLAQYRYAKDFYKIVEREWTIE